MCVCVCIKCCTYLGMVWPKKRVGIGLYKLRPNLKTMFVYQVGARVLPWCLEQTPKHLFIYCEYLFFIPVCITVGLCSGLFSLFVPSLVL